MCFILLFSGLPRFGFTYMLSLVELFTLKLQQSISSVLLRGVQQEWHALATDGICAFHWPINVRIWQIYYLMLSSFRCANRCTCVGVGEVSLLTLCCHKYWCHCDVWLCTGGQEIKIVEATEPNPLLLSCTRLAQD